MRKRAVYQFFISHIVFLTNSQNMLCLVDFIHLEMFNVFISSDVFDIACEVNRAGE